MDDDILSNLEAQIAGDAHASAERPKPVVEVMAASSAMDDALSCLPPEVVRRISTIAARYGIRHDADPMWALVEAVHDALACAQASGDAAQAAKAAVIEVQEGVGRIQGQILAGAMKAGTSIQKDMTHVIAKGGEALLASIAEAANAGAKRVEAGSKDLLGKLDAAVEAKKAEGVSAFAAAASEAAVAASTAAARQVISENKIKLRRSAIGMSLIFLIYAVIGGGVAVEYLSLTHRIVPHQLVMTASGKPNCGTVMIGGGEQEVCQIR
jgi:hypothetical protein